MRILFTLLAVIALMLAVLGLFLPLLPTTPFLLLAVAFASRESPRLHQWLYNHPRFGPLLHNWQQHGAISRRAKRNALILIALSALLLLQVPLLAVRVAVWLLLAGVAWFIYSRPEPPLQPLTPSA